MQPHSVEKPAVALRSGFLSTARSGTVQPDRPRISGAVLAGGALFALAAAVAYMTLWLGGNGYPTFALSFCAGTATLAIILGALSIQSFVARAMVRREGVSDISLILDAMPFAAILTDDDLHPIGMNPAASQLLGQSETGGAPADTVLPPALCDALRDARQSLSQAALGDDIGSYVSENGEVWILRCRSHGNGRFLWQLAPTQTSDEDEIARALPVVRIAKDGSVTPVNARGSDLLATLHAPAAEAFANGLPPTGQVAQIPTANGTTAMMVTDLTAQGGERVVSLVPLDPEQRSAADTVQADWDRFDDLPVPLMWLNPDGRVQKANRTARNLVGPDCRPGVRLADLTEGLGRPINDWLDEAMTGHRTNAPEFLRVTTSETEVFVQIILKPVTEAGQTSLLAVLSDATELKSLEAQFVQSQKMQAIGQLAGGVAHDFNNLLTAISGHCDLLLLRHDQGDPDYSDLMQINQNANRAAALVSQLLAFSRKQTLRPVEVDLRETVSDLTHLLNRLVGEKISLSFSHDPVLHSIRADKRQLEQVLMNLVVNARDAIPGGGEIRIVTEGVSFTEPFIRDRATIPPGDYVSVKVIDTGTGIPPERLSKVFEPFYTTKRIGEGTGLGLSTAYGIIKQTGGYIFVDSTQGQGTCFTLLFRAYKDEQKVMEEIKDVTKVTARHADGVVLLVEDEAPVRAFASRALRLRGYTVLEADSGEEALEILKDPDLRVDIFVSDVVMPGMDGPTWVRKALETRKDVRVIFVSGYAEENFGDEQSRIPNSVFLPKPFSLSELTQTVQGVDVG